MAARKAPPSEWLVDRLSEGHTHEEIVELWEKASGHRITTPYISILIKRRGIGEGVRHVDHRNLWLPWAVKRDHEHHKWARLLRAQGRRELKLPYVQKEWVDSIMDQLEEADLVIDYIENAKYAEDAFIPVHREYGDRKWISIRNLPEEKLSDEERKILAEERAAS